MGHSQVELAIMRISVCLFVLVSVFSIVNAGDILKLLKKKFKPLLKIGSKKLKDDKPEPVEVIHKKCDVIWEEKVTPLCKSVNHPQCHTEYRDECHKVWDTKCWDIQVDECTSEKKCEFVTEKQCKTDYTVTCDDHHRKKGEVDLPDNIEDVEMLEVSEDELSNPDVEKILTEPVDITNMSEDEVTKLLLDLKDEEGEQESVEGEQESVEDEQDSKTSRPKRSPKFSSITKVLKKGGKRHKREIELPEDIADFKVTPVSEEELSNPEVEKILVKPIDITDMSEDEIAEALLNLSEGETAAAEETVEEHNREKRSLHLHNAGAALLGGKLLGAPLLGVGAPLLGGKLLGKGLLKKGGKLLAPLLGGKLGGDEKPKQIVKEKLCHHHPYTECWDEPREKCWDEPVCVKVPKQKCEQVPREVCEQVDFERCEDVWEEQCEYMRVKVAKKHCRKPW